jgi:hypothetical protein
MAEIDFGILMREVIIEMDCARSNLTVEEASDGEIAGYRYQGAAARAIRAVFDEAEAGPAHRAVCPHCDTALASEARFCVRCGRPRTPEVMPGWLEDLIAVAIAKEVGRSPTDPQLKDQIARSREEDPEVWAALVERIWSATKA